MIISIMIHLILEAEKSEEDDPVAVHGLATRGAPPPQDRAFVTEEGWPGEDAPLPTAAQVASRLLAAGHQFRLLATGGRGQGAAQNVCLEAATAELVSLMDADDRSTPDRFARLHGALQARRADGWDAVCCGVKIFGTVSAGMARYVAWQNTLLEPADLAASRFVEIPGPQWGGGSVARSRTSGLRCLHRAPFAVMSSCSVVCDSYAILYYILD